MSAEKPKPHATPDSEPYWQAVQDGKLRLQRCSGCGHVRHYPQPVCPRCCLLETEWIEASGRGTIHSWTVAHHAFHPAFKGDLPYTLLIVDLAEGPRAMGRLDPASAGTLRLGLPVRIAFPPNDAGVRLPVFTLEG